MGQEEEELNRRREELRREEERLRREEEERRRQSNSIGKRSYTCPHGNVWGDCPHGCE